MVSDNLSFFRVSVEPDRVPRADPRRGAPGVPYADDPRCRDPVVSTDNRRPRVSRARHATPEWPPPTSRARGRARGGVSLGISSSQETSDLTKNPNYFSSPETHFDKGPRID